MNFKFDNIAISGGVAVGTTTLMENLKPYLEPYQWKFKSIGQMIRQHMKENIMPVASLVSDDFDRDVENKVYEDLRTGKNWVIEAWLAGFMARQLPNVLRVLMICTENSLRVDRLVNRDRLSVLDAKQFLKIREDKNIKKWQRLYGNHDFFNKKYYHLVIDTYSTGQLEAVGKVLDLLGYKNDNIQILKK